ncbi:MAG: RNA 2',3'-cyclic phosphodiesterase, partial [Anaerolineales bacterium]
GTPNVSPENIHLTLKFLGDVSSTHLDLLKQVILQEAASHPTFEVTVRDLGCFPNSRHPRVIWVGLDIPPALEKLQRSLDQSTARLGYASEARPYSPHLTLGRVNQHASPEALLSIRAALEKHQTQRFGTVQVTDVILFQSDLRPSGPQYTPLCQAPLGVYS